MRLTLPHPCSPSYLDDTLEPGEIKHIGQKVAESDAAQELIARIKQITRQRRITTPALTGPGAKFDANTVAEYLDNELPAEQLAELEKTCLESDVHLAEIATCHQILTVVLGEPALVPPTAKERMYQLVQGREAIPYRKAPRAGLPRRGWPIRTTTSNLTSRRCSASPSSAGPVSCAGSCPLPPSSSLPASVSLSGRPCRIARLSTPASIQKQAKTAAGPDHRLPPRKRRRKRKKT